MSKIILKRKHGLLVCIHEGCETIATFGDKKNMKPVYCVSHKKQNMIDVRNTKCKEKDCFNRAGYNFPDQKILLYCKDHAKDGMISHNYSKKCERENCTKAPTYGWEKGQEALRCATHKLSGMSIVVGVCEFEDCSTTANFGFKSDNRRVRCAKHKEKGMINVKDKRSCQFENCSTVPNYNFPGVKPAILCVNHKESGMVNVNVNLCEIEKCGSRALFSYYHEPLSRCSKHKERFMIKSNRVPKCSECKKDKALYNTYCKDKGNTVPLRCESCKKDDDINVAEFR